MEINGNHIGFAGDKPETDKCLICGDPWVEETSRVREINTENLSIRYVVHRNCDDFQTGLARRELEAMIVQASIGFLDQAQRASDKAAMN